GEVALLLHPSMCPRHFQPLPLAPPTAFLPPRQTALLLAQVPDACLIALGILDLLPRREGGEVREAQIHPHRALPDRPPLGFHWCAETQVIASRSVAREGHHVRPIHFGKHFSELERTELRQAHDPLQPRCPRVLKPQAPRAGFGLEP